MQFRLKTLFVVTAVVCMVSAFFWHAELPAELKAVMAVIVVFVIAASGLSALANSVRRSGDANLRCQDQDGA